MDGDAAPTAGPSNSSPPPPLSPPIALNALSTRTSSRNALRDTFQDARSSGSPPSTPPRTRRRTKVKEKEKDKGKQPVKRHASEDNYASNRHSHGLSWHSTTRDSVVDNLLFSLDNLSKPNLNDEDDGVLDTEFDKAKYMFPFAPPLPPPTKNMTRRERSHTYSSSLSSGYDRNVMSESPSSYSPPTPKGRRSNSGSNIGSSFGINTTISARMKPSRTSMSRTSSDTTRPTNNGVRANGSTTIEEGSERNSKDYGDGLSTSRLQFGRRSLSMDQMYADAVTNESMMSRGRPVPSVHSKFESNGDVAPEPMIPAGPRKKDNPTATGPVYINQPRSKGNLRKITTQTDLRSVGKPEPSPPIPQNIRNQASDFVRLSSIRGPPPAPGPQSSSKARIPSPVPGNGQKTNPPPQRPGFFKRVFGGGSSRSNSASADRNVSVENSPGGARTSSSHNSQSRTGTRQSSKDYPTGSTYPPVSLNKKPSSLFRRRKKSQSEAVPVPPLPVGMDNLKVNHAQPSPSVSSLRKIMDPFLNEDKPQANGTATSSKHDHFSRPTTHESSTEDSDNLELFHSGYTPPVGASLGNRDPLSRSPSVKPKHSVETQESARAKMKVKKRKPDALSPTSTSFLGSRGKDSAIESAKVSPVTVEIPADDKENQRPVSHASTGDRIIALSREIKSEQEERRPSVVSSVSGASSEKPDDSFIRPTLLERPDSKKSERLILKPTASEEILHFGSAELATVLEIAKDDSTPNSARSPAFHTATSATFPPEVHSPLSPDTQYHSATSLPLPNVQVDGNELRKSLEATEATEATMPSAVDDEGVEYHERARKIFEGDEEDVTKAEAAAWLGEKNTLSTRTLQAFMELFEFGGINILASLRALCGKLVLKGETQQFDRIIMAFSTRWTECNPSHGFKAQDVVHTICYSLILLNTDLHLADIGEKMSRSAYVKNTLPTIRRVVADAAPNAFDETIKPAPNNSRPMLPWNDSDRSTPVMSPTERTSFEQDRPAISKRLSIRPPFDRQISDGQTPDSAGGSASNALVSYPYFGPLRNWEFEIETILKSFFASIRTEPLPLLGAPASEAPSADKNLSVTNLGGLKRSNSVLSKAQSEAVSFRGFRNMTMGFQNKYNRSKPKLYSSSTMGSSRTSFDGDSVWSPVQSSNWSKYSLNKTMTSASMQSLGQLVSPTAGDFKHSIGFANALSQAIIREEQPFGPTGDNESVSMSVPGGLLEDESLALEGAPWAKEGLVKHKHHLEAQGRKAKERSWTDVFAVISKGKLTLFAFNTSSKSMSMSRKAHSKAQSNGRASTAASQTVGGGDWMENAEQLDVFVLRQTIVSTLPPPGYSKARPHVWALSLPSGAVHLFQVGTPEIAQEFMSTANYWSARLSKEPLSGGVSNIEYGWSDQVINTAALDSRSGAISPPPPSIHNKSSSHMHSNSGSGMPRPSLQSSIRTSLDTGFGARPRLPGDKVHLADWHPPTQSMMASQLMEVDQLKALSAYVTNVESELAKHNELKQGIELAYSPRHPNYNRAMTNWQRKSDYLLREIVKFQTYVDGLTAAQKAKEEFFAKKSHFDSAKAGGITEN